MPPGPVLELACGPSGSALLAAETGRAVTAVDVSEVGLGLLDAEAGRRGLGRQLSLVQADLDTWYPPGGGYALVLCTGYWDRAVFATGAAAVAPGGLLAWEAFTAAARQARPALPAQWCLGPGEPGTLLTGRFRGAQPGGHRQRERGTATAAGPRGLRRPKVRRPLSDRASARRA